MIRATHSPTWRYWCERASHPRAERNPAVTCAPALGPLVCTYRQRFRAAHDVPPTRTNRCSRLPAPARESDRMGAVAQGGMAHTSCAAAIRTGPAHLRRVLQALGPCNVHQYMPPAFAFTEHTPEDLVAWEGGVRPKTRPTGRQSPTLQHLTVACAPRRARFTNGTSKSAKHARADKMRVCG